MNRFSFALRKLLSKKGGVSSGGLWIAALLFAGLIMCAWHDAQAAVPGIAWNSVEMKKKIIVTPKKKIVPHKKAMTHWSYSEAAKPQTNPN